MSTSGGHRTTLAEYFFFSGGAPAGASGSGGGGAETTGPAATAATSPSLISFGAGRPGPWSLGRWIELAAVTRRQADASAGAASSIGASIVTAIFFAASRRSLRIAGLPTAGSSASASRRPRMAAKSEMSFGSS